MTTVCSQHQCSGNGKEEDEGEEAGPLADYSNL